MNQRIKENLQFVGLVAVAVLLATSPLTVPWLWDLVKPTVSEILVKSGMYDLYMACMATVPCLIPMIWMVGLRIMFGRRSK